MSSSLHLLYYRTLVYLLDFVQACFGVASDSEGSAVYIIGSVWLLLAESIISCFLFASLHALLCIAFLLVVLNTDPINMIRHLLRSPVCHNIIIPCQAVLVNQAEDLLFVCRVGAVTFWVIVRPCPDTNDIDDRFRMGQTLQTAVLIKEGNSLVAVR